VLSSEALSGTGSEAKDSLLGLGLSPVRIALVTPSDGHTLVPGDPPFVLVEGRVDSPAVSSVSVVANGRRTIVPVTNGRFRHVLPILEPAIELRAEVSTSRDTAQQTPLVTVRSASPDGSVGLLVLNWTTQVQDAQVHLHASWRARPDRLEGSVPIPLTAVPAGEPSQTLYDVRSLGPGVYTFTMSYQGRGGLSTVNPVLYVSGGGALVVRSMPSITLDGSGTVLLARGLLPQGVLWDEDDWFTGKTESTDVVIKFRLPEGVSWMERKAASR
jgi:hypothetical protein